MLWIFYGENLCYRLLNRVKVSHKPLLIDAPHLGYINRLTMWFLWPVCQVAILCYFIPKEKISIINLVTIIGNYWISTWSAVMSGDL